jgi:ABC-type glycerol-3-phosphate transport system permease component
VLTAETVILTLKVAVLAVTVLLAASLTALAFGRYRLHGRINIAVFVLTLTALLGLEVIARLLEPDLFRDYLDRNDAWTALTVHLAFSMPAAVMLFAMLFTGLRHRRNLHVGLGIFFLVLWTGTLVTGVFFLPHTP